MHKFTYYSFLLLPFVSINARVVEEIQLYRKTENIAGDIFFLREEASSGLVNIEYRINEQLVPKEEFIAKKAEATERELRECLEKQEKKHHEDAINNNRARVSVLKKLIERNKKEIEKLTKKIDSGLLTDYKKWKEETIASSSEYFGIKNVIIPKISELLEYDSIKDICLLERFNSQLEELHARLTQLYKESVNEAINKSDDAKTLKDLLELV